MAAKPAAKGMANCSMGTETRPTYLSVCTIEMSVPSDNGLIAAPKAITTTSTPVVTSVCRSRSIAM